MVLTLVGAVALLPDLHTSHRSRKIWGALHPRGKPLGFFARINKIEDTNKLIYNIDNIYKNENSKYAPLFPFVMAYIKLNTPPYIIAKPFAVMMEPSLLGKALYMRVPMAARKVLIKHNPRPKIPLLEKLNVRKSFQYRKTNPIIPKDAAAHIFNVIF